jgi:hypothetical protein
MFVLLLGDAMRYDPVLGTSLATEAQQSDLMPFKLENPIAPFKLFELLLVPDLAVLRHQREQCVYLLARLAI